MQSSSFSIILNVYLSKISCSDHVDLIHMYFKDNLCIFHLSCTVIARNTGCLHCCFSVFPFQLHVLSPFIFVKTVSLLVFPLRCIRRKVLRDIACIMMVELTFYMHIPVVAYLYVSACCKSMGRDNCSCDGRY
jgi:hypothetical protein